MVPSKMPGTVSSFSDVDQEVGEFVGARGRGARCAPASPASSREQRRIMGADHAAAGARRRDDVVAGFEFREHLLAPAPAPRRGRPSCSRAGRSRSASRAPPPRSPRASSSLSAAKPIDGRIRSTRQVTKRPTRMGIGSEWLGASRNDSTRVVARASVPDGGVRISAVETRIELRIRMRPRAGQRQAAQRKQRIRSRSSSA